MDLSNGVTGRRMYDTPRAVGFPMLHNIRNHEDSVWFQSKQTLP